MSTTVPATDQRATARVVLGLLAAGGIAAGLWPAVVGLSGPDVPLVGLVAHVSGMLAGYGVLVLMVLMSRWPVLEHGVGADRLTRWHATGGRTVLSLVLVHASSATLGWALVQRVSLPVAAMQVLAMPWLVPGLLATTMLVAVAVISVRVARRRMTYERWHTVHLLTYVAIALGFLHQLGGPDLAGRPVLQVMWSLLYCYAFALVAVHRVVTPARHAFRHRLRVEAVVPEAPGIVSIVLAGRHLHELQAQAGQFFRWRFLTPGSWSTAHPFSLSAPARGDRLRLTVKDLGDGSRRLQQVAVGTRVVAEGPYGAMTAARRTRRDVLLVAGGVGITPMRALFETIPIEPGQDLVLLYRASAPDQVVFRYELDVLARTRRARVLYLLGDDPELLSSRAFTRLVPDLVERDVYLCGPPGMSAAVRTSLAEAGHPSSLLHEERFAF